jgi:hypothetical protein
MLLMRVGPYNQTRCAQRRFIEMFAQRCLLKEKKNRDEKNDKKLKKMNRYRTLV